MHLTLKQIEDYRAQQLSVADVLLVTDHLADCEVCRRQIKAAGNGDAAFFDLRSQVLDEAIETGAHLTMDQAAAYADRHLTGEELRMADDHLTHCEECIVAVEDLRAFRNEIAPSLDHEYRPAAVPSPAESSWRHTFASLAKPFRVSPLPVFGGAALAILLLSLIAWLVWRTPGEGEPQIAANPTPAPTSQPSLPAQPDAPQPVNQPVAVIAQLNDAGSVLTLDQQGKLSGAENLSPAHQDLLKKTLSTGRIEKSSQLQGLTRASSSLMGSDEQKKEFAAIEPVGNVSLSNRLTFRWSAMEGATAYVVEVYDEKFMPVASSPQLTTPTWTTTLARGHVYSWQVKATKDGQEVTSPRPPAPQAKFRVLDQARANEIATARRSRPLSHLTLGLLYADAGLLREAEQEFRLLQKANPNSDLARNLLRQVQSLRR